MSWRDNLLQASFRGVEFHFESVGDQFGRRVKRHEYPGGTEPYHEDLGLTPDTFDIAAYILEPDHIGRAAQMRDAIRAKGPGTLVHPYYGEITVVALPSTSRFTTREGGMAQFQLKFERAGPNRNPSVQIDTPSRLAERATAIDVQANTDFLHVFNVDGAPGWVADGAVSDLEQIMGGINTQVTTELSDAAKLAEAAFDVADIVTVGADLVRNPSLLATRVVGAVQMAPGINASLSLATSVFELGTIAATTPSRLLQANNRAAIINLVNRAALSNTMRNLPSVSFETAAEAYAARDSIADSADTMMLTANDDVVRSLTNGLAAVTRHVAAIAPALPRVVTIRPSMTRPAIVHAFSLYGDNVATVINRAAEIAKRNRLRHPGLVPAIDALEVLGHA